MVGLTGVFCMQKTGVENSVNNSVRVNWSVCVATANLYFSLYCNIPLLISSELAPSISIVANMSPKSTFLIYSFKSTSIGLFSLYNKLNISNSLKMIGVPSGGIV